MTELEELLAIQGRLRGLVDATQLVTGRLSLPDVLLGVAEAAASLVGAKYAALGVLGPDGGLSDFVHTGMAPEVAARIGHLPEGKGLLGALIEDPRPIRLERIADDPRSSGFPPGHPAMDGFLGAPIRIRDEVFGNLYLAGSTKGGFTAEDEELTRALAATAAVAVENARLYQAARDRGEWMEASTALFRRLLGEPDVDAAQPLQLIAEQSSRTADADLVTVVRWPGADGLLHVGVAVGRDAAAVRGLVVPVEGSLAGEVLRTGEPVRLSSPAAGALGPVTLGGVEVGPVLVLPLLGASGTQGVLTVARRAGRAPFTADEEVMAGGFAHQAAVAVELAQARSEQQKVAMLDERERIAADLHDHVIQRLFASGLSIQAALAGLGPGAVSEKLGTVVEDLDTTISQIRTTIFRLQQPPAPARSGLRAHLLDVAAEVSDALGFSPAVRFSGVLDVLPSSLGDEAGAVLREGLSNVARHARATRTDVEAVAADGWFRLTVDDDGVGLPPGEGRRSGTANLARRAERLGGTFVLSPREPRGTHLEWRVPLG